MKYLLDYCKIAGNPVKKYENTKKYVATGDINENEIINFKEVYYNEKPSRANLKVERGEVLFAKMQNTVKVLKIDEDNEKNIYSTGFYSLKPIESVETEYLYWFLNSDIFNMQKDNLSVGATMRGLNNDGLKKILAPVFPDNKEQKNRANILNKIYKTIENRKQALKLCDSYLDAKFYEIFSDRPYDESEGKELEKIVSEEKTALKRGPFGGSLKKEYFVEEGYLVYEQRHAIHNDFEYAKYYIDEKKYEEMKGFAVKPGDLIVSCSGVTLGRIAEIPQNAKPGIINQALLKISLNNNIMLNDFFVYLFRSEYVQNKLFGFSRGSGIPNFPSMKEVKKVKFFTPSIDEQENFVNIIKRIKKSKDIISRDIQNLTNLLKGKMNSYFKFT